VKVATGTDIWSTGLWGSNGRELELLVGCGMTPLQAIEAATANGPDTLGPQAPNAGQLIEGMDADVICVDGDPAADITILGDPSKITHVFKAGARVKG
jgi:imidazolonepropionase-like amidohydrolase